MAKYILFDTETTGKEEEDRILQVGAMVVDTDKSVEVIDEMCDPGREIAFEAMGVHNITPEMVAGKPKYEQTRFKAMLDEFNNEKNVLIAHNLPFDLAMIKKEGFEEKIRLVDTLRCSRHIFEDSPKHGLQYLRYSMGLYRKEQKETDKHNITIKAHDAIGDVLVMKIFFSELIAKTQELFPGENPIAKLVELTKQPVFVKTFKFGKYKDEKIEDVWVKDKGYINWMKNNMDLDEDMLHTLDVLEHGLSKTAIPSLLIDESESSEEEPSKPTR